MVSGWFCGWIFGDLGMDLGSILAPKIDKKVIDFGIDFSTAKNLDSLVWANEAWPPRRRLRIPFWYPSGLQIWSPVVQRTSDQGLGTGALDLTRRGLCPANLDLLFCHKCI